MSEENQHPWGVPSDAPPPRRRTSWGNTDPQAAPAARDGNDAPAPAPVAPAEPWGPLPNADVDLAAFHAGGGEQIVNPFAQAAAQQDAAALPAESPVEEAQVEEAPVAFDADPAAQPDSPADQTFWFDGPVDVAGVVDDEGERTEAHFEAQPDPVAAYTDDSLAQALAESLSEPAEEHSAITNHDAADPTDGPHYPAEAHDDFADFFGSLAADVPAESPAPQAFTEHDSQPEPALADFFTADPTDQDAPETAADAPAAVPAASEAAGEEDLPELFAHANADDLPDVYPHTPAGDELPDLFAPVDAQPVDAFADALFDPADNELPAVPGASNVPAIPGQEAGGDVAQYGSTSEAMSAWRAMRADQAAAAAPVTNPHAAKDAELAHRYASAVRLEDIVDRILGLAQSGNTRVQSVINSLVLTRDHELDARQRAAYEEVMVAAMAENMIAIDNPLDNKTVLDLAYDEIIGVGPLGPLWRDDDVTEILVSGPDKIVCERNGRLAQTPVRFRNLEHLRQTARDLASRVDDRALSRSNPLVTAQLPKARVQFAVAPVAPVSGVSITIRKFRPLFGLDDLLSFGALDDTMAAFLSDAVAARANILVSGGTGSGKTTMINALSAFIPDDERVITIEDALELSLTNTHVESLLTKELASGDDKVVIGQDELLRASLRMRPDRIIVGEIRDGAGCSTMLQAANTGHDGTMTTVHANNPDRALRRLSQLLMRTSASLSDSLADEEVRAAFDVVVQVVRVRGRRFVSAVSMVNKDNGGTTPIFTGSYPTGVAAPVFARAGGMGSDTELAQRFFDAGMDPSPWE